MSKLRFFVHKNIIIENHRGEPYFTFKMGDYYEIEDPRYQRTNIIWNYFRLMVFNRDRYVCTKCGVSEYHSTLQVHHIKRVRTNPHLLFDIDNCVTLCRKCHKKLHDEAQTMYEEEIDYDEPEVLCNECGRHFHNPKYRMCYYCYQDTI